MVFVQKERLARWAIGCLEKVGVPVEEAKLVGESLAQTSAWGIDSHGVLRLTHYLRRLTIGSIKPAAVPVVTRTGPVTAQVHGEDGLGIVHATLAMEVAIEMARESGAGVVGVGHSSHCGAMGLYTRMAAHEHLIGIAMTHSSSVVVPHGGKHKYFGTNPISIAFPRKGAEPVCLDMATSQVAWNKVLNARIEGEPLDPGLAVDAEGRPTTDANAACAAIPLGGPTYGYKGYGLAFMVDLLCGALNGMTFGPRINGMYEELDRPRKIGHFAMALDPARFAGGETLEATVGEVVEDLRKHGEILFPGEPELIAERERLVTGIPIDEEALKDMIDWSKKLGRVTAHRAMKRELLVMGPMYAKTLEVLDATYVTHKAWLAKDRDALLASLADRIDAAATSGTRGMDDATMAKLPKLKMISHFGVGVDSIDIEAAHRRGILVSNTPDVLTGDVADLAIGLAIAAARRMVVGDRYVREGKWLKGSMPLAESLQGKTLGVVGMGRIGRAIARRAEAFDMKVAYQGPNRKTDVPWPYFADPVALAKEVDILVAACPGGEATRGLVGRAVLEALGPTGIVVNISRGTVIDEPAMVQLLQEGKLGGAGLDVFADEPRVPEALLAMDNVVLQPHVGSATHPTRQAMGQLQIDNLAAYFAGKPLVTPV